MWQQLLKQLQQQNHKALARCISLVENEVEGYESFLQQLPQNKNASIIGITGPPGAGKSTLTDALIGALILAGKKVGILCIDPSSPFNYGALLGDRIRMSNWYNNPNVFIRSLATRGSLGGLHPAVIEITSIMQATGFDYIIIETVGVGQTEVEIAGIADTTVVVLVPEAGDQVQTMKAGLMEIADIFVVNKSDRPGADAFVKNLQLMFAGAFNKTGEVPVIKTTASEKEGISVLLEKIKLHQLEVTSSQKKYWLMAERAYRLIQQKKMKPVNKQVLQQKIEQLDKNGNFNLYRFTAAFV